MRYEMKNFIKFAKSNVGPKTEKRDDWKRSRKVARKQKLQARKVA